MKPSRVPEASTETASPLRVDSSRCLRVRYSGSRCGRCALACPVSAILLDERLKVLEERCSGCLTCTTVCPSGALEAEVDFDGMIPGFAAYPFPVLVISCGRSGLSSGRRIPCLGMLSAEHLVAIFARSGSIVQLDASDCGDCGAGAMLPPLAARLEETEEETGLPLGSRIRLVLDAEEFVPLGRQPDRRRHPRFFREPAFEGASREPAAPAAEEESPSRVDKVVPTRRRVLWEGLASLPPEAARKAANAFSFSVVFGDSCDGCLGCVKACPTGALSEPVAACPAATAPRPRFDAERCTGCGLCAEYCLSGAVSVGPAG